MILKITMQGSAKAMQKQLDQGRRAQFSILNVN